MSYAPPRPRVGKKLRAAVLAKTGNVCWLCGELIDGAFDVDHEIARELGGADTLDNLFPAHPVCHRQKTKADVALIAHSNRVRKWHATPTPPRKPKEKRARIYGRSSIPSRPFPKRRPI